MNDDNKDENLRGRAWGNANLRLQTTIFKTVAKDEFGQLAKDVSVLRVWMVEKLGFDSSTAEQLFDEKRQKMLDRFFAEELGKVRGSRRLEKDSVNASIGIIRKTLVPFIDDMQRGWDEKLKDEITGQLSPSVIDMIVQVAPTILDITAITNPTAYAQMLRSTYSDYEIRFSYERQLSYEDKRHAEEFGSIIVKLKAAISPSP